MKRDQRRNPAPRALDTRGRRRAGGVCRGRLRRAVQFGLDALTGRLGVLMMTLSYAGFAVVLLGYVSTHVYTASLMEDVAARERQRRDLKEQIGRLTSQYASLASRTRVSRYCEDELGMIEAEVSQVVRVSVDARDARQAPHTSRFVESGISVPEVLGSEYDALTRVMVRESR